MMSLDRLRYLLGLHFDQEDRGHELQKSLFDDQNSKLLFFFQNFHHNFYPLYLYLLKKIKTPWVEDEIPVYEVLLHAFNHSTYHRGQVITMGRQLGFEDGIMTDFYEYLKLKSEKENA